MGPGEPAPTPSGEFPGIHSGPSGPEQPEVTMWNSDVESETHRPDLAEPAVRPASEPHLQKANLQAIASILAVGVLRRRARKGEASRDIGRKAKHL